MTLGSVRLEVSRSARLTRRLCGAAAAITGAALLVACASSSVVVGKVRPAISPDQVKLYLSPPARYEEIALLDASSKASFALSDQAKMDVVVQRLKEEAAKIGANGVLLKGSGDISVGGVSTGAGAVAPGRPLAFGGVGVTAGIMQMAGTGVAIFVPAEP